MTNVVKIAEIAHELNAAICRAAGDDSQVSWDEAPDWQKESVINGVEFHLANPDASPEESHENWRKEKDKDGWRYGIVKNPVTKTHPCMMPFHLLPVEHRIKDHVFKETIRLIVKELA